MTPNCYDYAPDARSGDVYAALELARNRGPLCSNCMLR
jgi:hypothetical protein